MIASVKYQMEMMSKNADDNREQKCLLITNRADEEEQYSTMQPIKLTTNNSSSTCLLEKEGQRNGFKGQRKKSTTNGGKSEGKYAKNTKRGDSLLTDEMELDNFKKKQFKKKCHDPGSNRGHLDLQSNALPTELSWQLKRKYAKNTKRGDSLLTDEMELDNLQNEEGIVIIDSSDDEDNLLSNFASINNLKNLEEENNEIGANLREGNNSGFIGNLKLKVSQRLKKLKPSRSYCCLPFWRTGNFGFKHFY
ncbi:hypothetical protein ACQ4LE_006345 [Meloidogyne hapla]